MQKNRLSLLLFAVCIGLVVFSDACLSAAKEALSVWWNSVLPALLPFSIFISLADSAGLLALFSALARPVSRLLRLPDSAIPCMLFGAVSGFPNGARLCALYGMDAIAACCNLCSPVFLISVVSHGMLRDARALWPLLLSHYGSALALALCLLPAQRRRDFLHRKGSAPAVQNRDGLMEMIRRSLSIMAAVGGCMVLFYVVMALLEEAGIVRLISLPLSLLGIEPDIVRALLHGVFEFSGGCAAIATLHIPLRLAVAFTAFTVSFGGLCVFLQSRLFLSAAAAKPYLLQKLLHGVLAAALSYLLFPCFAGGNVAAMNAADAGYYIDNALSGGSILLASSAALCAVYFIGLALTRGKRQRVNGPAQTP